MQLGKFTMNESELKVSIAFQ